MDLHFATAQHEAEGATVVTATGEIDVATAPALRERLQGCLDQGKTAVVVDLLEVTFLDSTGLGVLVGAARHLGESGGWLRIVLTEPRVAKVFEITGLTETLPIFGTVEEAVSA